MQIQRAGLARWLHILSGVMWIGLLYYFNVAQIPGAGRRRRRQGRPGRRRHQQVRRAARAVLVPLGGAWPPGSPAPGTSARRQSRQCLTLGHGGEDYYGLVIGIGAWLGTIMLFNVWVLIWPNQKKVLGIVAATDEEKARARKIATLASRTNFVLSIPMLLCMGSASHGLPLLTAPSGRS